MNRLAVYLIGYDLKSGEDYTPLVTEIKAIAPGQWWHYLDSTWFVSTTLTAQEVTARLLPQIDQAKDHLLVMEASRNKQGWLPQEAWDWLNQRLP